MLTIDKLIPFNRIVKMRWNNTLTVINNRANNGGYTFVSYKWTRNGQSAGTGQSWSAGANGERISETDVFSLEMETSEQKILHTTESTITLKSGELKAFPNPVSTDGTLYLEFDLDPDQLQGAMVEVYNTLGRLVETLRAVSLPEGISLDGKYVTGTYIFVVKCTDGTKQEVKVSITN
jgi:hypothetical protein